MDEVETLNDGEQGQGNPNPNLPTASPHNTRSRTTKANERSPDALLRGLSTGKARLPKPSGRAQSEKGRNPKVNADILYPRDKKNSDGGDSWKTLFDPDEVNTRAKGVERKAERINAAAKLLDQKNGRTVGRNKTKYRCLMERFTAIRDEIDTLVREGRRTQFSTRRMSTFQ